MAISRRIRPAGRGRVENIEGTAAIIAASSARKYAAMASSVPTCSATSNASPNSGASHPKKARARIRCAELETGRNSVSPWTIPSSAAASQCT